MELDMGFLRKVTEPRIRRRIFLERLTEPVHLNLLSIGVAMFGSFTQRVGFDLILRQHNAFAILNAAQRARAQGVGKITIVEFGVAAGAGLLNMCSIAKRAAKATGIEISVVGFDTGKGMPQALGYRDHPDLYQEGDFPMDFSALKARLPSNCELILGQLKDTIPSFIESRLNAQAPIAYVAVDVDYYSSTVEALKIFEGRPEFYLPLTLIFLDDIAEDHHNPYAGELLAIREYNNAEEYRKICRHDFLECRRVFRNASWLKQIYYLHVMDHPSRMTTSNRVPQRVLRNPLLSS
jgi:hypothetical protein